MRQRIAPLLKLRDSRRGGPRLREAIRRAFSAPRDRLEALGYDRRAGAWGRFYRADEEIRSGSGAARHVRSAAALEPARSYAA